MARFIKRIGRNEYVDGFHILALVQKLVREAAESDAQGSGKPDAPYTMSEPEHWISRWRRSSREAKIYYKLGGRLILKNEKLYVGDVGPAYLKGASREDSAVRATKAVKNFVGENTHTVNESTKTAWLSRNTIDDPTYRSGAQKVLDPGSIYSESADKIEALGGGRPTPWGEFRYTPILAKAIRNLLRGEKLSLTTKSGGYDRNYSRKQFMLPVFTTAIFHAEPARNERAWPINLMLLDLAEDSNAQFTWDAILWHPEAINPKPHKCVQANVIGPLGREPHERNLVRITTTDKLHLVGGILPASPTGGGERGKPALFKEAKPLHPQAIARGVIQSPGSVPPVPFDYIHQKEIDVLFRWLFRFPEIRGRWCVDDINPNEALIEPKYVLGQMSGDSPCNNALSAIINKIRARCSSLDYMI